MPSSAGEPRSLEPVARRSPRTRGTSSGAIPVHRRRRGTSAARDVGGLLRRRPAAPQHL